jgi:branched-chain amino acid transport system substrate-binding protein
LLALLIGCTSFVDEQPGAGGGGEAGAGGSGGTSGACDPVACTEELGVPALCPRPDHACVPVTSEDCTAWIGDATDAHWLGFVAPFSDGLETIGNGIVTGVELQHEEFAAAAGDSAPTYNVIVCDSQRDIHAVFDHLTENVRVAAVIGPALSSVLSEVVDSGTLIISPSSTSPTIPDMADDGLVWRTAPSDDTLHIGLAALTSELETRIRSEQAIPAGTPIRAAIVRTESDHISHTYDAFVAAAQINGLSITANGSDVITLEVPIPDASPDYGDAIATLAAFEPHLIIGLGFMGEVVDPIGLAVEAALDGSAPRPYYALIEPALPAARDASADAALRSRLTGVSVAWRGPLWDAFLLRHQARFGSPPGYNYAANAYDAAQLLAYALAATDDPSGRSLAEQLPRMVSGTVIGGQPSDIPAGLALASSRTPFDYEGASGPVDFDAAGEVLGWLDAWCFAAAGTETYTGYFDPKQGAVTGQLGCP